MSPAQNAIAALLEYGFTNARIAERFASTRAQISNIKRGLSPCPPDLERRLIRVALTLPDYGALVDISALEE